MKLFCLFSTWKCCCRAQRRKRLSIQSGHLLGDHCFHNKVVLLKKNVSHSYLSCSSRFFSSHFLEYVGWKGMHSFNIIHTYVHPHMQWDQFLFSSSKFYCFPTNQSKLTSNRGMQVLFIGSYNEIYLAIIKASEMVQQVWMELMSFVHYLKFKALGHIFKQMKIFFFQIYQAFS